MINHQNKLKYLLFIMIYIKFLELIAFIIFSVLLASYILFFYNYIVLIISGNFESPGISEIVTL